VRGSWVICCILVVRTSASDHLVKGNGTMLLSASRLTAAESSHFVDLGPGKCQKQSGGGDPRFTYVRGAGSSCEQMCLSSDACHGFSLSSFGNCLLWEEDGLRGGGASWGRAHCLVKKASEQPPHVPAEVVVNIGSSRTKRKCVAVAEPVMCARDAGNAGLRTNPDHKAAMDKFVVTVEGGRVCVGRVDIEAGWGMRLQILCARSTATATTTTTAPPPSGPATVVTIGRSSSNMKCVDAAGPLWCAANAGDRGIRVNPDYANNADTFVISVQGGRVCADREDSAGGWGMNLQIACVQLVPATTTATGVPTAVSLTATTAPASTSTATSLRGR